MQWFLEGCAGGDGVLMLLGAISSPLIGSGFSLNRVLWPNAHQSLLMCVNLQTGALVLPRWAVIAGPPLDWAGASGVCSCTLMICE